MLILESIKLASADSSEQLSNYEWSSSGKKWIYIVPYYIPS